MGAAAVWLMTAAWIELAPASVLPTLYGEGLASQSTLDHCDFEDILVFGDSKILVGLDRAAMSFPVLNFAQGGGTPAVDFYRTQYIPHCDKLPKLVVLSYSVMNLRRFSTWNINNSLISRLLSPADVLKITRRLEAEDGGLSTAPLSTDDLPPVVRAVGKLPVPVQTLLYRADFPPLYWASIQASLRDGVLGRLIANQQAGERVLHSHGHDYWDWSPGGKESRAIFTDAAMNRAPRSRAIEGYYQRLVDRFAERGVPVLIATVPLNEPTFRAITQSAKDDYAAFLHGLAGRHGNVTILEPIWAVFPATSFADQYGHVNGAGQAEITQLINRCITALLHTPDNHGAGDCRMDHNAL